MHFTVTFISAPEDKGYSYGLVFIPSPVWMQGKREILNLNPERPAYQVGSVHRLLKAEGITFSQHDLEVVLTVHPHGNGTWTDFQEVVSDLQQAGYRVHLAGMIS